MSVDPREVTEAQALARDTAHRAFHFAARSMTEALDQMHAAGFAIPEPVQTAVLTASAYGVALHANHRGQPTPEPVRALLGLPPIGDDL